MKILATLLHLAIAFGFVACASKPSVVSGEQLMARMAPSVEEWDGGMVRLKSATKRMWVMIPDGEGSIGLPIQVGALGEKIEDAIFVNLKKDGSRPKKRSAAVPITTDGYFLTAKHSARGGGKPTLFFYDRSDAKFAKAQAEVIWQSSDEADLALLRTSQLIESPFKLADAGSLSEGSKVGATGWSGLGRTGRYGGMAAGEIRSIKELQQKWWQHSADPVCWKVEHNAPLQPGDSGGPLIDVNGRLVAIHSGSRFIRGTRSGLDELRKFRGISNIPDRVWLMQFIEKDRLSRPR